MNELIIETAENGFIVRQDNQNMPCRQWAFETAESLSKFILEWGVGDTKCTTEADLPQCAECLNLQMTHGDNHIVCEKCYNEKLKSFR